MARRGTSFDEAKIAHFTKEGRGIGCGADYKPWLTVQDVPSTGREHRVFGVKTGRIHHLLSDIEWCEGVLDIREQFPLDREATGRNAESIGVRHPQDVVSKVPMVMTADFVVDVARDGKIIETRQGAEAIEQRLRQADEQFRAEALSQLAEAEQKAASLAQDLAKAEQRDRLYKLTAPVAGVVQQLAVHAVGAVVAQAQPVLMIVPEGEGIAIEAALQNKDAGFVLPGQAVEIKVESFPFTRYGTVPGEVLVVSSDTVQGPDSDPTQRRSNANDPAGGGQSRDGQGAVYSVRIRPARDSIAGDGRAVALTPGMAVTAEIKTGRRRVIEYVLDPVMRYRAESFRER